jgi:putative transposase
VVQAYRFALDPDASRLPLLHSHAGAARAACNWAVARVSGSWEQRAAEESYGLTGDGLTPWQGWTLPALRKSFNAVKVHDPRFAGWWDHNPEEAYSTGLANAAAALGTGTSPAPAQARVPKWVSRGSRRGRRRACRAGSRPASSGWSRTAGT